MELLLSSGSSFHDDILKRKMIMATTSENRNRPVPGPELGSEYNQTSPSTPRPQIRMNQTNQSSGNTLAYIIAALVIIIGGYFLYNSYYGPTTISNSTTTTTKLAPADNNAPAATDTPAPAPQAETPPAADTPAVTPPADAPATDAPAANAPAAPATPPATTTP
jgi:hypothetical protein